MRRTTMVRAFMGMPDLGGIRTAHGDLRGDIGSMQPSPTQSVSRRSRVLQSGTLGRRRIRHNKREGCSEYTHARAGGSRNPSPGGMRRRACHTGKGTRGGSSHGHAAPRHPRLGRKWEEFNERIAELQQLPPVPDLTIQELRALDLSGWQLHQQQWLIQRERLFFAVHQIEQAQVHPSQRPDLWVQWTERQQQFLTALEDLRAQRHALERKRIAVESQLLERYFK